MAAPARAQVLSLMRSLLRHSSKIVNYNFRAHAKRRTRAGFDLHRDVTGEKLVETYRYGLTQLEIVKRQALISQLYPDSLESVMQQKVTRS
jgi:hypothetical protein